MVTLANGPLRCCVSLSLCLSWWLWAGILVARLCLMSLPGHMGCDMEWGMWDNMV